MRTMRTISLLCLVTWLVHAKPAFAQGPTETGIVVAACGGSALTAGQAYYVTIDLTGKLCAGIGGTVTINSGGLATSANQTNGSQVATVTQGPAGTAGWPTYLQACSGATCYSSPVNSGATVVASGSTSQIFSTTTALGPGHCNNKLAAAVNFTIMDGSSNYLLGPNFSIPSLGSYDFPLGLIGQISASGLNMSAGTASAITCWVRGAQ